MQQQIRQFLSHQLFEPTRNLKLEFIRNDDRTFNVGHEYRKANAGITKRRILAACSEDFRSIGHLRDPFRRDKGRGFDDGKTGFEQASDEGEFCFSRNNRWLVLETVAWPNFHNRHPPTRGR